MRIPTGRTPVIFFEIPAEINWDLNSFLILRDYPEMEMISFGPTIKGAHSPDERAQISSVQKFWGYLLETLEKL